MLAFVLRRPLQDVIDAVREVLHVTAQHTGTLDVDGRSRAVLFVRVHAPAIDAAGAEPTFAFALYSSSRRLGECTVYFRDSVSAATAHLVLLALRKHVQQHRWPTLLANPRCDRALLDTPVGEHDLAHMLRAADLAPSSKMRPRAEELLRAARAHVEHSRARFDAAINDQPSPVPERRERTRRRSRGRRSRSPRQERRRSPSAPSVLHASLLRNYDWAPLDIEALPALATPVAGSEILLPSGCGRQLVAELLRHPESPPHLAASHGQQSSGLICTLCREPVLTVHRASLEVRRSPDVHLHTAAHYEKLCKNLFGDGGFDDGTVYGVLKPLLARAHDSLALPQIYDRLRLDRLRDRFDKLQGRRR